MNKELGIVWLNYNSSHFLDIASNSLVSIVEEEPGLIVFVDNNSNDKSDENLKSLLRGNYKFIKLDRNIGYAGGMNIGYQVIVKHGLKYVAFVTNDLVIAQGSMSIGIEYLSQDDDVACVQGVLYVPDGRLWSAGCYLDELMGAGTICGGISKAECLGIHKPQEPTYLDGAYIICKSEVLKRLGTPFIDETFAYLDDNILGLRLWNTGYRLLFVPHDFGVHYVSQTFRRTGLQQYYALRSRIARLVATEVPRKHAKKLHLFKLSILSRLSILPRKVYIDGVQLGKLIVDRIGKLSLCKAPHLRLSAYDAYLSAVIPLYRTLKRKMFNQKTIVTYDKLTRTC